MDQGQEFVGKVTSTRPDLSVIVIAQRAEPTASEAIRSLLDQAHVSACEVVVVAHSDSGPYLSLDDSLAVKVIYSSTRLSPGAARNAGVAAASGSAIAFLAADCVAEPGWIDGRVSLHRKGMRAVASAMTNAGPRTISGWASHYALFASRLPGRAAGYVSHPDPAAHGLSYERQLLADLGPFDEQLRIGEDSDMAARLNSAGIRIWFDPSIRTGHRGPNNLRALVRDQFNRGARSAAHAALRESISSVPDRPEASRLAVRRIRSVARFAWRHGEGERWRIALLGPVIALASISYQWGWIQKTRMLVEASGDPSGHGVIR